MSSIVCGEGAAPMRLRTLAIGFAELLRPRIRPPLSPSSPFAHEIRVTWLISTSVPHLFLPAGGPPWVRMDWPLGISRDRRPGSGLGRVQKKTSSRSKVGVISVFMTTS